MKNVIVFGANGYLGRHLALRLKNDKVNVLPVSNAPHSADNFSNYISLHISDKNAIEQLDFDVDAIFVFAGLTGTTIGFDQYQEFILANEVGLLNILNHHKKSHSKARIVFPSTRLVYQGQKDTFLKEHAHKEALTIYAQTKLACENYLNMYHHNFGIDYTIFRICVPYGNLIDNSYSYGTLGFFLDKAMNNQNITLFGDGTQKRTFTHVEDIISSLLQTLEVEASKNNIINIGSNDNLSLVEVAHLIANKYKVGIDFIPFPEAALKIESGDTLFDDEVLQQIKHYNYKHTLSDWISMFSP